MRGSSIGAFLVLCFACCCLGQQEGGNAVMSLTDATFTEAIRTNPIIMVEFFAPWCGHCQQLAPEYEALALMMKEKGIPVANVDVIENQEIATQQQIDHYPTLKLFKYQLPIDYTGPRNAKAMASFIEKTMGPSIVRLNTVDEISQYAENSKFPVCLALFDAFEGEDYLSYTRWAERYALTSDFAFAESACPEAAAHFQVSTLTSPSIVAIHKDGKQAVLKLEAPFKFEEVDKWLIAEGLALLDEIGPQTYGRYVTTGLPIGWVVVSGVLGFDSEEDKALRAFVEKVAAAYKHKIVFTWIDDLKYHPQVEMLAVGNRKLPTLVITEGPSRHAMETEQFNEETLNAFLEQFFAGKLAPTILSEPIPEHNDGPVYKIVGKTFDRVAFDPTKDVLVKFYAPWCGHCQALAPIYEQLAAQLSKVPTLLVAEIDATKNDIPNTLPVEGFPTIILFPAGAKENPVVYEGSRTLEDMFDFVKQHCKPYTWDELGVTGTLEDEMPNTMEHHEL